MKIFFIKLQFTPYYAKKILRTIASFTSLIDQIMINVS